MSDRSSAAWSELVRRAASDDEDLVQEAWLALALLRARYVDDERAKDLAARSGRSANTVRWLLKDALRKLRVLLTPMREDSMKPDEHLQRLLTAFEQRLDWLGDEWSGRLVAHLRPDSKSTTVEAVDFIPSAPRHVSQRLRRILQSTPLPGCPLPPKRRDRARHCARKTRGHFFMIVSRRRASSRICVTMDWISGCSWRVHWR